MVADPEGFTGRAFTDLAQRITELKPLDASGTEKKKGVFSFLKS